MKFGLHSVNLHADALEHFALETGRAVGLKAA